MRFSALCLCFVCRLRGAESLSGPVTVEEQEQAKHVDQACAGIRVRDVLTALRQGKQQQLIQQLKFQGPDDVIRCRGRLENADLADRAKFPALLPPAHHITLLVFRQAHQKVLHNGVAHTLVRVRTEYWIPTGRAAAKKAIHRCVTCKHVQGLPFATPDFPPLPMERVSRPTAFTNTGLDYFGPLYVFRQAEPQKVWVALFTCMTTRAVHMECVEHLKTSEFLLALRRFISRRGAPQLIVCDNAPQFALARTTLDTAFETSVRSDDLQHLLTSARICWRFIVPLSPWMGGFYERMVGLAKRCQRKTLGNARLQLSQLVTMLSEVEAVLNSRPLTYVGDDIEAVLTPSAFLCHRTTTALPLPSQDNSDDPEYVPNATPAHDLVTLWAKGERLLNAFWQQWRNEYLAELRDRHQRLQQRGKATTAAPAVGSIVLLADDAPRATWRLARIVDLQVSADGHIRSATVITADNCQLKRPLRLLYPLECEDVAPAAEAAPAAADTLAATATPAAAATPPPGRPQRAAAARQRQQLQQLINSDKL